MSNVTESLENLARMDGAIVAALVDSSTGMLLGGSGNGLDLEIGAAGTTEVVRAEMKTVKALGLRDVVDDVLITLSTQFHVIRPTARNPDVFLYLVLDRDKSNLGLARIKVKEVDSQLEL